jgi:5-methyltetrahydropteroyltriglutamate--homocysteine methyltransferase
MKRSERRVLTTHTGSLPRPPDMLDLLHAKDSAKPHDREGLARRVRDSVRDVVRRQAEIGLDVIGDGEHSKSSFAAYCRVRLGGLKETDEPAATRAPTRDSLEFPAVYEEARVMLAARTLTGVPRRRGRTAAAVCAAPVTYIGQDEVQVDIANLKAALTGVDAEEAFITALSPTNLELYYRNEFYRTEEEYLFALADAMREEYKSIVDGGFLLQIDDPRLATHYNRTPGLSVEDCRKFIAVRVEALNHALRGIPEDRVRFHTCYSVNVAPRVHDLELRHFVDLMLKINAGAYSIEAANPRHEHEWRVFEDVKLPEGKILIPGVVSHCVHLVEHPELVAQRIARFAGVLGRENVIAGTDCGFATSAVGDEVHPDVAWAKLRSLVEGARLATRQLWGRT